MAIPRVHVPGSADYRVLSRKPSARYAHHQESRFLRLPTAWLLCGFAALGSVRIMTGHALPTTSVLIPSYRRPERLVACLTALAQQTVLPDEVLVVWQGDDQQTKDVTVTMASQLPYRLRVLHNPEPGIVPAENLALASAVGDVICLTDDDAIPPPGWLERFLPVLRRPIRRGSRWAGR